MSVTIVSADRQALREWETAQTEAERRRNDWQEMVALNERFRWSQANRTEEIRLALLYAQAANNAEILRQRYEAMILEEMAKEFGQ